MADFNELVVVETSFDGRIKTINNKGAVFLGYELKSLLGKNFFDLFYYEKEQEELKSIVDSLKQNDFVVLKEKLAFQGSIFTGDNKIKRFLWDIDVFYGEGDKKGFVFTGVNVAKIHEIYDKLALNEQRYQILFENANDAIFIADVETEKIVDVNKKGEQLLGMKKEEIIGMDQSELHPEEESEFYKKIFREHVKSKSSFGGSYYVKRKDGRKIPVEISSVIVEIGNKKYNMGIFHDISDRKKVEEKLQKIFDASPFAILIGKVVKEEEPIIVDCNPAALEMFGYTKEEIIGTSAKKLMSNHAFKEFSEIFRKTKEKGGDFFETIRKRKNGTFFPVEVSTRFIEIDGEPHVIVVLRDITKIKDYQMQLEREKERLKVTLASIGDGVIATDAEGRVVEMNPTAEKLTGWKLEEAKGKPLSTVFNIINEHTREPAEDIAKKVLDSGRIVGLANDTLLISKNGEERIIADSGAPIKDKNGKILGVVVVFRDITEKKKNEMELLKVQTLESLGVVAGGIAHDFNNILTGILGNVNLARLESTDEEVTRLLYEAEKACLRAKKLTYQLLTFSKGGMPVKEDVSLKSLIKESARFVLSGTNVNCTFEFDKDLWNAYCDPAQISQVVQNLVLNAVQAMPEGGTLRILGKNLVVSEGNNYNLKSGEYVKISVIDEGEGIDKDLLHKIFEPYFTTKKHGVGLGLSVVFSIIKNHGGTIKVDSVKGVGTEFTFFLPKGKKLEPELKKDTQKIKINMPLKVLVMDDDFTIRDFLVYVLKKEGFGVESCATGSEALTIFKKSFLEGDPFDLVVLDLTVRGDKGGKEVISRIKSIKPDVKSIVISGFSKDDVISNFQKYGFDASLIKPFSRKDILKVISRLYA